MLDGLRHDEDGPSIGLDTRASERWRNRAPPGPTPISTYTSFDAAPELDAFYTQAIGSDAAFTGTLDFTLKTPDGADMAIARLGGWAQDVGPN